MRTEDDLRVAFRSLEEQAPDAGAVLAAVREGARRRPAGRRRLGRGARVGVGAGAGLTAVAAGVALALVLSQAPAGGRHPAAVRISSRASATGPAVLTARDVLLAAAASAKAVPDTGAYWETELVGGQLWTAGPNAHPFAVIKRYALSSTWDARSDGRRSWTLPAAGYTEKPATPGALAAWRADGSPALPGWHSSQQAWWRVGGDVGGFGNANLTLAQFQALPSDVSGLRAAISGEVAREGIKAGTVDASQRMFGICAQLLKLDPITSGVRAAVFQVLATVPGVRSIGRVTDPLGRTGYGIEQLGQNPDEVLVIAPGTGTLLADEELESTLQGGQRPTASGAAPGPSTCPGGKIISDPVGRRLCETSSKELFVLGQAELALPIGTLESYDVLVSQGWTNAPPPLPPAADQFSIATQSKG